MYVCVCTCIYTRSTWEHVLWCDCSGRSTLRICPSKHNHSANSSSESSFLGGTGQQNALRNGVPGRPAGHCWEGPRPCPETRRGRGTPAVTGHPGGGARLAAPRQDPNRSAHWSSLTSPGATVAISYRLPATSGKWHYRSQRKVMVALLVCVIIYTFQLVFF